MYELLSVRLVLDWSTPGVRVAKAKPPVTSVKTLQVREIWLPNQLFQILDHSAFRNGKREIGFENKTYARSSTICKAKINIYLLISKFHVPGKCKEACSDKSKLGAIVI